jgi:hypothetical protein
MLSHNPPPFHGEHIGSLLRPSRLLDQRAKFARNEIDRTELTDAEDEAIKDALGLQERVGLKLATDGEFRRRSYHSFFYRQLGEISIDTVGGEDAYCLARIGRPYTAQATRASASCSAKLLCCCLSMLRSPPADRHPTIGCQSYREHQISDLA